MNAHTQACVSECSSVVGGDRRTAEGKEPQRAAKPAAVDERFDRWGSMMIAAQRGDDEIYDELFRELHTWLHRYYRRRLAPSAAEDATQEALLAVHTRRYTYQALGPFGPWLAAIARYKWMDRLRQQYREPDALIDEDIAVEDHGSATLSAILVDQLIDRLKPAQAKVIRLVKIYGASIEEASGVTGQSESLVKVNIHRGLKKIATFVDCSDHFIGGQPRLGG